MSSPDTGLDGLLLLVQAHPQGLSEYALLRLLYAPLAPAQRPDLSDTLVLFQQHFLLFHQLYRLREQLRAEQCGELEISALCIRWLPLWTAPGDRLPAAADPLRDYYLNLQHLQQTGQAEVDQLLGSFWRQLAPGPADAEARARALTLFELPATADWAGVRRRYRQLMALHHPDRGGCPQRSQDINAAMAVLRRCFSGGR